MSKNFEEEYKALTENELPDLWSRIDAGLTPKTTADETIEEKPTEKKPKEKKGVILFFKKYKTVVAAAVCAIVIIPTFMLLGDIGSKNYSDASMEESTTTDMAADEIMEEGEAMAPQLQASAEDNGIAGGSAASDTAEACEEAPASEEVYADEAADCATEDTQEESSMKKADTLQGSNSTTTVIYDKVTVKVLEETGNTVDGDNDIYHEIKVRVLEDASQNLMKGTELSVYVPITSSVVYVKGMKYEVDISYEEGNVCEYQVVVGYSVEP